MTASTDEQTRRVLRLLGETALRLADGAPIDPDWLEQQFVSAAPNGGDRSQLLTVTEACAQLRISRWSFYRLLHQRQLQTVTIGRRRFVAHAELHRFVAALGSGAAT